ncbi:MAG TPA: IS21 family transposase [Bacteroidia bacterium]|nr:IS21 family transposase [Bacteroidia bacterium]
MAQKPIEMEQLKQVLQLSKEGVKIREIARRVGISRNSVRNYLRLLESKDHLSDKDLAENAYNNEQQDSQTQRHYDLVQHFIAHVKELGKPGVTRQLLWTEYLLQHADGYGYSQYCHHLGGWLNKQDLSMHLEYIPGDLMMIDFAGKKFHYTEIDTGKMVPCEVFVSVLPYSGMIFCLAVASQQTADFVSCINRMLQFFGGIPKTILCDNLKTAVIRSDKYEPVFTDVCHQLSAHYQTTFSAARPYEPRDKAMVEKAVNIVYNNIYGPLRNDVFHSPQEVNRAFNGRLLLLNDKSYKGSPHSRKYFFDIRERQTLGSLPIEPFSLKKVSTLTVQRNYHIQIREQNRYYSVPYQYAGKKVQVYYDNQTVEVYCDYERIALHHHNTYIKAYYTLPEHMPPAHQAMQQRKGWTKEELLQQARRLGDGIGKAAALILESHFYVEQNYKSCFGMMMLRNKYGVSRLEAACNRALQGSRVNYHMIKNILERGLDQVPATQNSQPTLFHENIRGKENYQ